MSVSEIEFKSLNDLKARSLHFFVGHDIGTMRFLTFRTTTLIVFSTSLPVISVHGDRTDFTKPVLFADFQRSLVRGTRSISEIEGLTKAECYPGEH